MNGVGIVGRILPNHLADKYFGPLNMLIPVVLVSSVIIYAWIGVHSRGGLYAWAVMYGIFGAAIQSLFPATLASLTSDLRKAGVRMGMIFVSHLCAEGLKTNINESRRSSPSLFLQARLLPVS